MMTLANMRDEQEAQWRKEFETAGREAIYSVVYMRHGSFDEPKRQFAFRWLREKEKEAESQGAAAHWYAKWTFWAAVAAVVVGVIGVFVTWYWH